MEGKDVNYVFLLNGYDQEVPESPDRKNSVVAWADVNTFTLELSGEPEGTEDGCRYALFFKDGPEGFFLAHLGDNNVGSVDVDGDPAIAFVTDCIPSRAIASQ